MQHRVVLCTEDLEPITVLQLTEPARQALLKRDYVILQFSDSITTLIPRRGEPVTQAYYQVVIYAEPLFRNGKRHHILFTKNEESARLLKAAFLPVEQSQFTEYEAQGIANSFLDALERLG